MDHDRSGSRGFRRVVTVPETASTQDDLHDALVRGEEGWPHLSALRALRQTAGRGRQGRSWQTPAEGALTVSVVLRPLVGADRLDWLPLVAGLAVRESLLPLTEGVPWRLGLKWPNDVVAVPEGADVPDVPGWAGTRKVAGVLAELVVPGVGPASSAEGAAAGRDGSQGAAADEAAACRVQAPGVVLGIGVNVGQDSEGLPVPWATSLRLLGSSARPEDVMALLGRTLAARVGQWEDAGGDPDAGDGHLGRELRAVCTTLGQQVSVRSPAGVVRGTARDVTPELVVDTPDGPQCLRAGEVSVRRQDLSETTL
ncbi:biotin--[acetyl-CoA-carboxylase] ligase [Actinomyces lilanjuaniae]|uniref:biotin--[biotin carboxyl-carrier protein] ligase n=1 Tax=Actinomyces lilanjuaniae TaxID=2321394 RepID=A0ABN5PPK4_9ACTO|nr:biotin--[acetyl-CoA-carboxylase] ligase [Actinomyces lilanjuaniae]AYD90281.1 biotin--[acetyl-CoA-carboxylase] ligase [Actinomyces lilanjuaniae]